jgi:hypothetical protein
VRFDRADWHHRHWDRLDDVQSAIEQYVPIAHPFILVDDDALNVGGEFLGRPRRYLLDQGGKYAGPPSSGDEAVSQMQKFFQQDTVYVVFMWYTFWWLDYYVPISRYLDSHAERLLLTDSVMIYRLLHE